MSQARPLPTGCCFWSWRPMSWASFTQLLTCYPAGTLAGETGETWGAGPKWQLPAQKTPTWLENGDFVRKKIDPTRWSSSNVWSEEGNPLYLLVYLIESSLYGCLDEHNWQLIVFLTPCSFKPGQFVSRQQNLDCPTRTGRDFTCLILWWFKPDSLW